MSLLTTRRALVACAVSLGLGLPALAQSSLASPAAATPAPAAAATPGDPPLEEVRRALLEQQIGRASCRERV